MIPPTTTLPGSFMASAIPGAGMFNPVGVQSQQATSDKTAQAAESVDAAELTLQGQRYSVFLTRESWLRKRLLALTVVIVGWFCVFF